MLNLMRPVLGGVVCVGRTCLQRNSRFLQCQASLQYSPPGGPIIAATKKLLLVSSGLNSVKYNNGLLRQVIQRRCLVSGSSAGGSSPPSSSPPVKLSLFKRFKTMYKDYWYVMLPVHVATSVCWFGAFYYISACGVNVGKYLRQMGVNEKLVKHVEQSSMGHIAVAWAIYKIATPIRYAVTLGGTTVAINSLRNLGYIKPAKELMAQGRNKIKTLKDSKIPKN